MTSKIEVGYEVKTSEEYTKCFNRNVEGVVKEVHKQHKEKRNYYVSLIESSDGKIYNIGNGWLVITKKSFPKIEFVKEL